MACCGCLLVDLSLKLLSSAMEAGMQAAEQVHAQTYEQVVLARVENSLEETQKRLIELTNSTNMNRLLQVQCENEILFELKKANSLEDITKSLEIYSEYSEMD